MVGDPVSPAHDTVVVSPDRVTVTSALGNACAQAELPAWTIRVAVSMETAHRPFPAFSKCLARSAWRRSRDQRAGAIARPALTAAVPGARAQVTRIVSSGPSARALARCTAS